MRGRVLALWVMVNQGSAPVGGLLMGAITQVWGVSAALAIGGVGAILSTIVVWARLRVAGRAGALGHTRIGASLP